MPVFSLSQKPLGLTSAVSPPGSVTGLGLSVANYVVTASWTIPANTPHTSVEIEWSEVAPAGSVAYGAATVLAANTTSSTRTVSGNRDVRARVRLRNAAGQYSDYTESANLRSIPNVVTGVSATNTATPGSTSVTWTNPASGNTDVVVRRTVSGSTTTFTSSGTSLTDVVGSSYDASYTLAARNATGEAAAVSAGTVRTQPKPTTTSGWSAANPGSLTLTWNASAQDANLAGYDVSLNDGGATQLSNVSSYQWTGATHGSSYYAKVRTRDSFGQVSAWSANTGSVTGINDTTAPTISSLDATWGILGYEGFTVSWSSSDNVGVSNVELWRYIENGANQRIATGLAASADYNDPFGTTNRGLFVQYQLIVYDAQGNWTSSTVSRTSKPYGTFNVGSSETRTWKTAGTPAWRTDVQDVISGNAGDGVNGVQHGFWFYGNDVTNTCKGYIPDNLRIFYQRNGSLGVSGSIYLVAHPLTTSSGNSYSVLAPTLAEIDTGLFVVGSDVSGWYTINNSYIKTVLGNGTAKGIASIDPGGHRRLRGINTQAFSGALELTFN